MTRTLRILSLAAVTALATGCVTAEKYNALKMERDRISEQLGTAQGKLQDAQGRLDVLQRQLDAISGTTGSKEAMLLNLTQENADLRARLDELNKRYQDALNRPAGVSPLPEALSNELSEFARQNPDLVEFDAARGIVKFKSDVTFAVGDAELTPKAKEVINRFSAILRGPAASQYELLIAGHTDNQPVRNPMTIQKGHKDNWYLSSHRAIAVGAALVSDGVGANRIGVIGYADQHPIAPNSTAAGQAQNRRVEVLILPTTVKGAAVNSAPANTATPRPQPKLNKDGMPETSRPGMNK